MNKTDKSEQTKVSWLHLTETEVKALETFVKIATNKGWGWKAEWPQNFVPQKSDNGIFRDGGSEGSVIIEANLDDARKEIAKLLKPGRRTVDVVAFKNGGFEEVSRADTDEKGLIGRLIKAVGKSTKAVKETVKEVKAGATIALPTQGCPEPRLAQAEIRAREVLFAFLDEEQQQDYLARNAFVSVGAMTGHRYAVTSRHAKRLLQSHRRQLYDLDEGTPYCVHDYAVPAAEEMLAIHLLLQIPEREAYLRHLES